MDPPKLLQVKNLTRPGEYLRQAGDLPANADGVLQSPAFAHLPSLAYPRSAVTLSTEHPDRNAWLNRMLHVVGPTCLSMSGVIHALIGVFKMCIRWSSGSTDSCDQELMITQEYDEADPSCHLSFRACSLHLNGCHEGFIALLE